MTAMTFMITRQKRSAMSMTWPANRGYSSCPVYGYDKCTSPGLKWVQLIGHAQLSGILCFGNRSYVDTLSESCIMLHHGSSCTFKWCSHQSSFWRSLSHQRNSRHTPSSVVKWRGVTFLGGRSSLELHCTAHQAKLLVLGATISACLCRIRPTVGRR